MSKRTMEERLDEILGLKDADLDLSGDDVEEQIRSTELVPVEYAEVKSHLSDDLQSDSIDDYKYARKIMYGLIGRGTSALEEALRISRESEHPRAIEVANGLMRNLSEITKDLVNLSKDMNKSQGGVQPQGGTTNVQNNFYVARPGDMPNAMAELDAFLQGDGLVLEEENEED